jgi:hypothetical protein
MLDLMLSPALGWIKALIRYGIRERNGVQSVHQ